MTPTLEQHPGIGPVREWLDFEPDEYLDRRRQEWSALEAQGLIRYERRPGDARARVWVAHALANVARALEKLTSSG